MLIDMNLLKFKLLLLAILASVVSLSAQDMREIIKQNPNYSASNLLSYIYQEQSYTPAPKGFKPFYISTYGRHGSRWHTVARHYEKATRFFVEAEAENALTELGREVYERMKVINEHAKGREGMLTEKGVREHHGIAERMVRNFPEIFSTKGGRECRIDCFSTLYPRCILSMAANNERIKELNPEVQFTRTTGERYKRFMSNTRSMKYVNAYFEAEVAPKWKKHFVNPDRFLLSLFKPEYVAKIEDKSNAMFRIYRIAGIMQNFDDIDVTLYDIFTAEELYSLWLYNNAHHYVVYGSSLEFGDVLASNATALMHQIMDDFDDVIANGGRSGCLRFGHDMILVPLINLLELEGRCPRVSVANVDDIHKKWQDVNITSMAANVQIVLYRNKQGEVLVKVLHNEKEVRLPFKSDVAPYYRWEDFRRHYAERIKQLEQLELPDELEKYRKASAVL